MLSSGYPVAWTTPNTPKRLSKPWIEHSALLWPLCVEHSSYSGPAPLETLLLILPCFGKIDAVNGKLMLQIINVRTHICMQSRMLIRTHTCMHEHGCFPVGRNFRDQKVLRNNFCSLGVGGQRFKTQGRGKLLKCLRAAPSQSRSHFPRARSMRFLMGLAHCGRGGLPVRQKHANRSQMLPLQERGQSLHTWENLKELWKSHKS